VLVIGVDGVRFDQLGPDTTPAISRPHRHPRLLHRDRPGRRARPVPGGDRPGLRRARRGAQRL